MSPHSAVLCPCSIHLLLPRLLTFGWAIVEEVGCHFPFTFDLNHPTTLQHVAFARQHLIEVCRHLRTAQDKAERQEAETPAMIVRDELRGCAEVEKNIHPLAIALKTRNKRFYIAISELKFAYLVSQSNKR